MNNPLMNDLDLALCDRLVRGLITKQRLEIARSALSQFEVFLPPELLLSGIHYPIPSPCWLRYHPSEASCLLYIAPLGMQASFPQYPAAKDWQLLSRSKS